MHERFLGDKETGDKTNVLVDQFFSLQVTDYSLQFIVYGLLLKSRGLEVLMSCRLEVSIKVNA